MEHQTKKRVVTAREAISLLNEEGNQIHTFRNSAGMLLGCDHDRERLIEDIKKYESTLEIAGDTARRTDHGLVLFDETGALFIEVNKDKLDIFDPII